MTKLGEQKFWGPTATSGWSSHVKSLQIVTLECFQKTWHLW